MYGVICWYADRIATTDFCSWTQKHIQPHYRRDLIHSPSVLRLLTKPWEQNPELTLVLLTTPFAFGLEYHISQMLNPAENFLAKCSPKIFSLLSLLTPLKEDLEITTCYKGFQVLIPRALVTGSRLQFPFPADSTRSSEAFLEKKNVTSVC